MIYYYIAAGILMLIGSVCGYIHYQMSTPLIQKAWAKRKYLRTSFLIFLLGPLTWLAVLLKTAPVITIMLTIFFLQEDLDD